MSAATDAENGKIYEVDDASFLILGNLALMFGTFENLASEKFALSCLSCTRKLVRTLPLVFATLRYVAIVVIKS